VLETSQSQATCEFARAAQVFTGQQWACAGMPEKYNDARMQGLKLFSGQQCVFADATALM
jgi:hypothetical protein